MLPHNKRELLEAYRKMMKDDSHSFDAVFGALERLRCLTVLWGLEQPENVQFQDVEDKRHTLLAYKHLDILWFDELPASEDSEFKIRIRGEIPRSATPEKVLETFRQSNEVLAQSCSMLTPTWIDRKTKSINTSLASFPLEVASA